MFRNPALKRKKLRLATKKPTISSNECIVIDSEEDVPSVEVVSPEPVSNGISCELLALREALKKSRRMPACENLVEFPCYEPADEKNNVEDSGNEVNNKKGDDTSHTNITVLPFPTVSCWCKRRKRRHCTVVSTQHCVDCTQYLHSACEHCQVVTISDVTEKRDSKRELSDGEPLAVDQDELTSIGKSDQLKCCPFCQEPFSNTASQEDIDGHLATCLQSDNRLDDVP